MEIKKLPVKWLQESFGEPEKVFMSETIKEDRTLVFLAEDELRPYFAKTSELWNDKDTADVILQKKMRHVNNDKDLLMDYLEFGDSIDNNWMNDLVNGKIDYYKRKMTLYERIIKTYRTGIMNVDGISFRIKNIISVKFCQLNSAASDFQRRVVLGTDCGNKFYITLHSSIDISYFEEFFEANDSGYVLTNVE